MSLVYEDDLLTITWNDTHAYLMSEWKHVFRKGDDLRRAYRACVDAAKARRGALWLIDSSKFSVVDLADVQWIQENFWPEFIKAGATYAAVIVPEKEVSKMSAERSAKKAIAKGGFHATRHASRAEAEAAILEWRAKERDE